MLNDITFLDKSLSINLLKNQIDEFSLSSGFLLETLNPSSKALFCAFLQKITQKDILIISVGKREDELIENITSFTNKDNILEFPFEEASLDETISPTLDITGERFGCLEKILKIKEPKIIFSSPLAVLQKIISKENLNANLYNFEKNSKIPFSKLETILTNLGYTKCAVVSDKGEFAVRGGILDIFSPSSPTPYRIEFFGDTIESIRKFDNVSQKTIEKTDKAFICPASEQKLSNSTDTSTILDFLPKDSITIFDNLLSIEDAYINFKKLIERKNNLFISFEDFLDKTKDSIFFTKEKITDLFNVKITPAENSNKYFQDITFDFFNKKISTKRFFHPFASSTDFLSFNTFEKDETDIFDTIQDLLENNFSITFLVEKQKEEEFIKKSLKEKNIEFKNLSFKQGYLSSSIVISDIHKAFLSYSEFTHKQRVRRQKFRSPYHTPEAEFHAIKPGDLVTHFHSGIGRYLGTEKHKNHLGQEDEFLVIEYDKNSKLFVPASQSYLVSKYIGKADEKPQLHTLGSNKWQKTKLSAQQQIVGYASDLLHLYAERSEDIGFAYPQDSDELKLFEMDFPYEETPDQLKAIEEIKTDMKSKKPMERLVCGDVGYGKTEVAMRAAFKAVADGKKQVAVLVPTTVLAMQHFESFKERMQNFPINIELISRFNKPKKNREVLEKAQKGQVDILVGTHKILSKDVHFNDLGLIIIDEEQRFGVKAKEHLKKIKKNADSLTLSATPIPRSLYMSLINIREMSSINTPPQDRIPIKSVVAGNDDTIIKNAIIRELTREGQIFFIHNRVDSIYKRADYIQKLVPQAKILVVHGQMSANEIDRIFHSFKTGEADILFTTTIVENGIDIPNANTILIDHADCFGVADLYQLRGRVGRWNKTSYAYFLIAKNKTLSEVAKKRLDALLKAGGYGGGMKIAMKDLEIRGAGDILGEKQSGQISAIGFHLYCKLLKRALFSLKNQKPIDFTETKIEYPFLACIPEYYIAETNLRMEIYYRIGDASSDMEVDNLKEEIKDRFGKLPTEIMWLLAFAKIRIFANKHHISHLKIGKLSFKVQRKEGKKTVEKTFLLPVSKQQDPQILKNYVLEKLKEFD